MEVTTISKEEHFQIRLLQASVPPSIWRPVTLYLPPVPFCYTGTYPSRGSAKSDWQFSGEDYLLSNPLATSPGHVAFHLSIHLRCRNGGLPATGTICWSLFAPYGCPLEVFQPFKWRALELISNLLLHLRSLPSQGWKGHPAPNSTSPCPNPLFSPNGEKKN